MNFFENFNLVAAYRGVSDELSQVRQLKARQKKAPHHKMRGLSADLISDGLSETSLLSDFFSEVVNLLLDTFAKTETCETYNGNVSADSLD